MHVLSKCQRLIPLDYGVVVEYAARTMAIIESTYKIFDVVTREWQAKAIDSLVAGNDLFVRAGTGCGKSLVYQSMTTAKPNGIVLVLAPLKSLMNDQFTKLMRKKVPAVALTHEALASDPQLWTKVDRGDFRVVYASPEILLNKKSHFFKHTMTQETTFSQNLTLIAMDEAHTVWSNRNYRREFSQIFRLRLAFPQVPFAALSATFPPHVVSYVQRTCGMKSTCNIITMNGRRVNIDIVVAEQPKQKLLQPLFNDLIPPNLRRKEEIPKTFIFVDSVLSARRVAIALRRKFRKKRLNEDTKVLVRTYYSSIDLPMKQKTHELIESGDARIVICTDSLSLGVDFPDIERVIQWGVDEKLDLNTLVQRIGRAARDPEVQGIATIYAPKAAFEPVSKAVGEAQEVHHAAEAVNKVAVEGAANGDASGWEDEEYAGVIPCYQNRDLASYALPVTSETLTMVEKFAAKMYKHAENLDNIVAEAINEQMGSKTGQPTKRKRFIDKIEPALLWFLNTTGCRHRCILHYLRYPDVFTDRQQRSWCCDNCAIRCGLRPKDTSTAGMSLALSIRAPPSALQQLPATIAKAPMAPRPVDMIQMPTRFRECLENYRTEAWSQLVSRGVIAASFPEHLVLPNSALRKIVASVRDIHSVESVVQILKSVKFDTHASLIGAEGAADIFTRINALVEDHIRTSAITRASNGSQPLPGSLPHTITHSTPAPMQPPPPISSLSNALTPPAPHGVADPDLTILGVALTAPEPIITASSQPTVSSTKRGKRKASAHNQLSISAKRRGIPLADITSVTQKASPVKHLRGAMVDIPAVSNDIRMLQNRRVVKKSWRLQQAE